MEPSLTIEDEVAVIGGGDTRQSSLAGPGWDKVYAWAQADSGRAQGAQALIRCAHPRLRHAHLSSG